MTNEHVSSQPSHPSRPAGREPTARGWLWDHIGRLSGIVLGVVAFALLVLLAALGWPPAFGLVVVIVIGLVMIVVGGRIKGV